MTGLKLKTFYVSFVADFSVMAVMAQLWGCIEVSLNKSLWIGGCLKTHCNLYFVNGIVGGWFWYVLLSVVEMRSVVCKSFCGSRSNKCVGIFCIETKRLNVRMDVI